MKQRDYDDLQELKEQAKDNLSFGAYRAYINGLEYHLEESKMLNIRLRNGIDAALCASDLANKQLQKTEDTKKACAGCGRLVDDAVMVIKSVKYYCKKCYAASKNKNRELTDREKEAFEKPKEERLFWECPRCGNRVGYWLGEGGYRLIYCKEEEKSDEEPVVKEDTEKKVTCDRCGKCVDVWDIVEIGSKEYCRACEKLYDEDREAFEKPVVKEVTESAWEAIRQFINETNNPLFHDFARAITWLKQRADDERNRIILLGERLDHIKEQLSGGDMK